MISSQRRAVTATLWLATGTLLVGGVAVATPIEIVPASWQVALGAAQTHPPPPTTSRPHQRTVTPDAAALPTAAPALTTVALPASATPPPTTERPPTSVESATPPSAPQREPEPAPVRAVAHTPSGVAADVIERTNKERREAGCKALQPDGRLAASAQQHAEDMAEKGYFSHSSRDGTRFDTRIRAAGHPRPAGENIAKGQTSASQVVREWMASPSHRAAIENCAFKTIGVGYDSHGDYWVQDFGR